MTAALLGMLAMLGIAMLRVPMALAMALAGFGGLALMRSWEASATSVVQMAYDAAFSYSLSVIPLFVLMGSLVARSGMAEDLFELAHAMVGQFRAGLAMTAIVASAGFGAVCGSSIATAASMSGVAYQPMRDYGYADRLLSGSIAAGGTLGILIPPSSVMIIYGIMTENDIARLFAAGLVPGIVLTVLYCLAALAVVLRDPTAGPASGRFDARRLMRALARVWGVLVLFGVVMGGLYGGLFTATEGAAVGAFGALVLTLAKRQLSLAQIGTVIADSARSSGMLFAIIIGAMIFGNFVNFTSMGQDLGDTIQAIGLSPLGVIVAICVIYLLLGMAMEELTMMLLTLPIFYPIVVKLGFDPIWFGVLVVLVVMFGMISPPVGMVLFVIKNTMPGIATADVFRGVVPFLVAMLAMLAALIAWPAIALGLPALLFGPGR
jgi:tripartite ATP-independent transporter DctM subunit